MKGTKKAIYDRKYYWDHVEQKRKFGREYYHKRKLRVYEEAMKGGER